MAPAIFQPFRQPFGDAFAGAADEGAGLGFVDIFLLADEHERGFAAGLPLGKGEGFCMGGEGMEVVVAFI